MLTQRTGYNCHISMATQDCHRKMTLSQDVLKSYGQVNLPLRFKLRRQILKQYYFMQYSELKLDIITESLPSNLWQLRVAIDP